VEAVTVEEEVEGMEEEEEAEVLQEEGKCNLNPNHIPLKPNTYLKSDLHSNPYSTNSGRDGGRGGRA
jgi:hypothetical protein